MRSIALGLTVWLLGAGLTGWAAEDPPKKLSPEERKQLEAKLQEVHAASHKQYEARKYAEATKSSEEELAIARRLYPREEYADGHPVLATSMNELASLLVELGKHVEAEALFRESLAMRRRLFKGEHPDVAESLNNLAVALQGQAKYAEAEPLCRESLAMTRRLHPGDHLLLAHGLNNLANALHDQAKFAEAEALYRESLAMRRRLFQGNHPDLVNGLNNLASVLQDQGKYTEAEPLYRETLAMARRLFPGGHLRVAASINNLAGVLRDQGKYAEAEPLFREVVAMARRLFPGGHPGLATSISSLALVLQAEGKYAEAEPLCRESLAMARRLYPGDHPDVARSLNNLASVLHGQEKYAEAETLGQESLAMARRLHPGDHPQVAAGLTTLAGVLQDEGKYTDAEALLREGLAMHQRLFPGDHPSVAISLNNLARLLVDQGKDADAERFCRDAVAMNRRLFPGGHPSLAVSLSNLAVVLQVQGKYADAEGSFRDALRMYTSLLEKYARERTEGDALNFLASLPGREYVYLSCALALQAAPEAVYPEVWASKGSIARVFERRSLASRAAASDPKAAALLARLTDLRRRRADLILARQPRDPATREKRDHDLKDLADRIVALDRDLRPLLPALGRSDRLVRATPADLQKALPKEAVLVDLLAYTRIEQDPKGPGKKGRKQILCYLAFVVSRDAIRWVDLGPAKPISEAVALWREALTTPPFTVAADLPTRVHDMVWAKVRREFPGGTRVVYLSPDLELSRVPWAALPGERPGRLLLEEFALAVVPHGPFLLDQLWPQDPAPRQAKQVLVTGGIAYSDTPRPAGTAPAPVVETRSAPTLPLAGPLTWSNLPAAEEEARAVAGRAARSNLEARLLTGADASAERVLAELPRARFAHLATHGFFADARFHSVLQTDPKQFERSLHGRRLGAGALSPLVLSGLVFAGANRPETPGRGLLTGEALLDRDLSGLELAVLSACETGLGDVAGGEGVFGLQHAFHLAGCRNVVASQWKVNDAATAVLMGEFYRALWDDNLPPILALQRAQLAVYHADPQQFTEMALRGFGSGDKNLDAAKVAGAAPVRPGGRNPPALWAAFTLSGAGR